MQETANATVEVEVDGTCRRAVVDAPKLASLDTVVGSEQDRAVQFCEESRIAAGAGEVHLGQKPGSGTRPVAHEKLSAALQGSPGQVETSGTNTLHELGKQRRTRHVLDDLGACRCTVRDPEFDAVDTVVGREIKLVFPDDKACWVGAEAAWANDLGEEARAVSRTVAEPQLDASSLAVVGSEVDLAPMS